MWFPPAERLRGCTGEVHVSVSPRLVSMTREAHAAATLAREDINREHAPEPVSTREVLATRRRGTRLRRHRRLSLTHPFRTGVRT